MSNEYVRQTLTFGRSQAIRALLIPCMKMILRANQNPCRDVAVLRLYIRIHTLIQQRPLFDQLPPFCTASPGPAVTTTRFSG